MPINRYQIRNVYSLADPELYKAADKDDPEALLEGVAMAGLVGVLRLLGDLAEFAAEIFHDLHEEVMSTAARGHGLLVRVQQLESEIPQIERAFLSQTSHSAFFPNSGIDWHPNRQTTQNLITTGDLPRFVMDSYEECRGPPRLFLLDKFDVGGAGACLKRYTDPSIFKVEASSDEIEITETQREKKIHQMKKKGSRGKRGETPEASRVKLHQLFLEERVQTGLTEPVRRVKLKIRPKKYPFDSENGELYMNKLLNSPSHVHEDTPVPSNGPTREGSSILGSPLGPPMKTTSPCVSYTEVAESQPSNAVLEVNDYLYEDVASETENYMDALGTMESEVETSITQKSYSDANNHQIQSDSQSNGADSPPQPFACIEIPFHPRLVPPVADNIHVTQNPIHDVTNDTREVTDVDHVAILEEGASVSNEEHQMDEEDGLSSYSFVRNIVRDLESKYSNDNSIPMILVPGILKKTKNQGEDDEETHSINSLVSSSQSVISHVNDQIPVTEDIREKQLKENGYEENHSTDSLVQSSQSVISPMNELSSDTTLNNHIQVTEDIHEQQLKEKVDAMLVISDEEEAKVSYSSGRESESDNAEIEPVTVNTNDCIDYCDVNRDDGKGFGDDTKLDQIEADSVNSDMGTLADVLLTVDVNNCHSVTEQDSKESGEKEEVDEHLVILEDDMDIINNNNNNNNNKPSLYSKILQDEFAETDEKQEVVLPDSESKSPNHINTLEAAESTPLKDKVDQSNSQLYMQLTLETNGSQLTCSTQEDNTTENHTHLQELQLVPENPPSMESSSHDVSISDQVKREDLPPLPPLPPKQWRMKNLQNTSSISTNGGQMLSPDSKQNELQCGETHHMPTIYNQQIFWPSSNTYRLPPFFDEMPSYIQPMKIQRPRSPLIDAVAAHDKTKLRKVSDRDTNQIPKVEERETLLDQIRSKSINLKPAVHTRPMIQGPNTNLRVAAILEKANAIRQAFAGSADDDDESDNWSD